MKGLPSLCIVEEIAELYPGLSAFFSKKVDPDA
jgi:hypothetical protein